MQPHHVRLKAGCRSAVASTPRAAREPSMNNRQSPIRRVWRSTTRRSLAIGYWASAIAPKVLVLAAGFAPALATLSTSGLCIGLRERTNWSLQPALLRQDRFTKAIRRLLRGGNKWSQSPVLPRTRRAYETHLSAGSTAKWIPHPELHRANSLTERTHR